VQQFQKENQDFKAQIAKESTARDFELQGQCATASKIWFKENWGGH